MQGGSMVTGSTPVNHYKYWAGKPPHYFTEPPRSTQHTTLSSREASTRQNVAVLFKLLVTLMEMTITLMNQIG